VESRHDVHTRRRGDWGHPGSGSVLAAGDRVVTVRTRVLLVAALADLAIGALQ
jgi:hypothetical protein